MLQISTGKFFDTDNLYVTIHRGVVYTNYRLDHPIETIAGTLRPLAVGGSISGMLYEGQERVEKVRPDGTPEFMISVGGDHLLQDFAAVSSFALRIIATPDPDLARRLTQSHRLPLGVARRANEYVGRVFADDIPQAPNDGEILAAFVRTLIGLERTSYEAAMRAIRRWVSGLHRIGDDVSLAYTLLVASIESLGQRFDGFVPEWDDYDPTKRRAVDAALQRTDASFDTRIAVRAALLDAEHAALGRRFRQFAIAHLTPAYTREEAVGELLPARRRDLPKMLERAYRFRSAYVHELQELPRRLTLAPGLQDVFLIAGEPTLTVHGLARLARHVITTFVHRARQVEREPFAYRSSLPNIVKVPLADSFWLHYASGYSHRTARRYLSGFLGELTGALLRPGSPVTGMPDVMAAIERTLPGVAKPSQRLPMLVLYLLYHRCYRPPEPRAGCEEFVRRHATLLEAPSMEALLAHLLLQVPVTWSPAVLLKLLDECERPPVRTDRLEIPRELEAGAMLLVAEACRVHREREMAREAIRRASESLPGHPEIIELEQTAEDRDLPSIDWLAIVFPSAPTVDRARPASDSTTADQVTPAGDGQPPASGDSGAAA